MTVKQFAKDPLISIANSREALVLTWLFTVFGGMVIAKFIEGWSWVDAFYWAGVAGTSTGFGDITPDTAAGKIFCVIYLYWSILVLGSLVIAFMTDRLRNDPDAFTHEEQEEILAYIRGQKARDEMILNPVVMVAGDKN